MKRRLRKKLRRGEFAEKPFDLKFSHPDGATDAFWDAFIAEIDRLGLGYFGRCGSTWDGALFRPLGEESRARVLLWLYRNGATDIEVGAIGKL